MDESSTPLRHSWDTGYWTATGTPSDSFLHLNQVESAHYLRADYRRMTPIHVHFDECDSLSKEDPPSLLLQICSSSVTATPLSTDNASVLATPASEAPTRVETSPSPLEPETEVDRWLSLRLFARF